MGEVEPLWRIDHVDVLRGGQCLNTPRRKSFRAYLDKDVCSFEDREDDRSHKRGVFDT